MASSEVFRRSGAFWNGGLQGVRGILSVFATGITAPNTSPASVGLLATNTATPLLQLTLRQTAPLLAASGTVLQGYSTTGTGGSNANALIVACPSVSSASLAYPAGSIGGAKDVVPAVVGADGTVTVPCAPITGASVVKIWLMGLPALAVAADATPAVPAPNVSIQPGVSFKITGGLTGSSYGWEVMFA